LKLEESRRQTWQLALAATGKKHHLFNRIERIMKTKKTTGNIRHIVLAMLIMAGSLSCLAWLNPTIANGKLVINHVKPAEIRNLFIDTTPRKATAHTSVMNKKQKGPHTANRNYNHNYNNHNTYLGDTYGFKDPELEKLSAEVSKHGEAISKYYESAAFKRQAEEIDKKGKEIEAYYNRPEVKQLVADQEKLGKDFQANWGDNSATEGISHQMEQLGKKIEHYYTSPEFKQMNAKLEKKYGVHHGDYQDRNDENYRKYQEELRKNTPADVLNATDEIQKLGNKIRARYDSPEFHAQTDRLRAMGDSIRRAYNNDGIKQTEAEMRKIGDEMRNFQNNPEIKREQERLREATTRLHKYMETPEFKQRFKEYQRTHPNSNWYSNDDEKPEHPERPEKPEAPEQPDSE